MIKDGRGPGGQPLPAGLLAPSAFPPQVIIEVTSRCNLSCLMCARNADPRAIGDIPGELFDRLRPDLPRFRNVLLAGHGEPLLHPGYLDMLAAVKAAGCAVESTTNATMLDDTACAAIVAARLDRLVVSLDAASPELFARIRRGATLALVTENLRRLREHKRRQGSETPRLAVNFVGMRMNIHELPATIALAAELGAACFAVLPVAEYPLVHDQSLLRDLPRAAGWCRQAVRTARAAGIELLFPGVYAVLARPSRWRRWLAAARRRVRRQAARAGVPVYCTDPWQFGWILRDGRIRPCCVSERIMGDLRCESYAAIWQGEPYREWRRAVLETPPPDECHACQVRKEGMITW